MSIKQLALLTDITAAVNSRFLASLIFFFSYTEIQQTFDDEDFGELHKTFYFWSLC